MDKGTDDMAGCSGWYIVSEAECSDTELEQEYEEMFEGSDAASNISGLIDDATEQPQGNSLQLFQSQQAAECELQLAQLKRKYLPSSATDDITCNLSPRLEKVVISPVKEKKKAKKSLFGGEDSGIVCSHEASGAVERSTIEVQVQVHAPENADLNNIPCSGQVASQKDSGKPVSGEEKLDLDSEEGESGDSDSEDEVDRAAPEPEPEPDPDLEELQKVLKEPLLTADKFLLQHKEVHKYTGLCYLKRLRGVLACLSMSFAESIKVIRPALNTGLFCYLDQRREQRKQPFCR